MGRFISEEFKRQAVVAYKSSGKSVNAISEELGVSCSALGKWTRDPRYAEGSTVEEISELELAEQVGQLKRELTLVRMERDYLQRGLDFIARESGTKR